MLMKRSPKIGHGQGGSITPRWINGKDQIKAKEMTEIPAVQAEESPHKASQKEPRPDQDSTSGKPGVKPAYC